MDEERELTPEEVEKIFKKYTVGNLFMIGDNVFTPQSIPLELLGRGDEVNNGYKQ